MRHHDNAPHPKRRAAAGDTATRSRASAVPEAAHAVDRSPRQMAQRRQLGASFGPVAQRMLIRRSNAGKYKAVGNHPPAQGDIETDVATFDQITFLLGQPHSSEVRQALLARLGQLHNEGQEALQSSRDAASQLNEENKVLKGRIDTATTYLKEDGEALSKGGVFRELVVPVITGSLALVNGPVNAFRNTATLVDVTLATAGVASGLQVANDITLAWSADDNWRRGYLITAMACQFAAQMLVAAPGTDDPLFQAPAQNDTLAGNSTAPIGFTGSYEGNKGVFVTLALLLGLLATFFRLLDVRQSHRSRTEESKRRVREVNPSARFDGEQDGDNRLNKII